ncbi:ribonuclease H family protein [Carboxylicivirga linearis]|uniref:ribonuclease H n=1 Tax=Carboxylicivirga linearis TaxID=1628157 RepID=A0ABS5JZ66_9BACT|nr:ribonuclease H [Carboxylicivirga linearis]MBS2100212.1 ribonuclease HI [Carboxylicivirga linearis]
MVGQEINCVFIEDFNFLEDSAYNSFIRLDRRKEDLIISTSNSETKKIHKVYTDGSYASQTMTSGYGGIIESTDGSKEIFCESFLGGGSNKMELLAVLDGLKRLQTIDKIQVITDSRYVIRGMIQWMHFWKHNNWQTAYGTKVKFADYWQQIDEISNGKLIEFNWIKGHSGHTEQDLCHRLAKNSAKLM